MTALKGASVGIIGVGGMGLRHARACAQLGAEVAAVCDTREASLTAAKKDAPQARAFTSVDDFIADAAAKVDLVSVVTNTPSRAGILLNLARAGARRVLTEKPFTTNVKDAHAVVEAYETAGIPLTVNTFRHFSDNHLRLRDLLRSGKLGKPRHMTIQSASTGLGNMGSVYFDVMNFLLDSKPIEITGSIDKTGTPSVRGPQFKDPGGFGTVLYENGARGFIDTSEDTGVPYTFHIATSYGRVFIDELFNRWHVAARTEADQTGRPLTYYLSPLVDVPFELTHGFDPVEMTGFSIRAALDDQPEASNARAALQVMEMIMAMHVSDRAGRTPVRLPLDRRHHDLDMAFA